ncbi:MAG: hypothetical protein MI919_16505 [Holophagales bacterium]|nr:hypothetical protein [Holophagales bacterium]
MHSPETAPRLSPHRSSRAFTLLTLAATICVSTAGAARAQLAYSIEHQGPTIGLPATAPAGAMIGAGDVLIPGAGTPAIVVFASTIGIAPGGTGQPEVDALSFGNDPWVSCDNNRPWLFSVDEFAVGVPTGAPDVRSEGSAPAGNQEASADIYASTALPSVCQGAVNVGNAGFADGNGMAPFAAPGLSLIEPNPPTLGAAVDPGDNLDALACSSSTGRIFFSLDANWPDPLEGAGGVHSGTALANGVSPGAVLVAGAGGGFSVYATPFQLGLVGADDLDALVLRENGNGIYEPSSYPFDWLNGQTDMLLFSVKRDSPLIGTLDALNAMPIEDGDILTVTTTGPGILVFAEALGLWTARANGGIPSLLAFGTFGDNLDGLALQACFQGGDGG